MLFPKITCLKWWSGFFVIALVLLLCITPIGSAGTSTSSSYFTNKIQRVIPFYLWSNRIPGAVVALSIRDQDKDKTWIKSFGFAHREKEIPMSPETVFQVGSISRAITVWGVLKLVEQGKVDLDRPVEEYLTRWQLPESKYDRKKVTVRRLLGQTAGLSPQVYSGYHLRMPLPAIEHSLNGHILGAPDLNPIRLINEPGKVFNDTGVEYTVLQLMVEEITGMTFADYMQHEVLLPLGMEHSFFNPAPYLVKHSARGYDIFLTAYPPYRYTEQAAIGLYSTATDLLRFVSAAFPGPGGESAGRGVLNPDTVALMFKPGMNHFGLGYYINKLSDKEHMIYLTGVNQGWQAAFAFLPHTGDSLVILTNSDRGLRLIHNIFLSWMKWRLGKIPPMFFLIWVLRTVIIVIAFLMLISFVLTVRNFITQIQTGRRRWAIQAPDPITPEKVSLMVGIPLLFFIFWVLTFYTGIGFRGWIIASLTPMGFDWVTVGVSIWCFYVPVSAFFPKIPSPGRKKKRKMKEVISF